MPPSDRGAPDPRPSDDAGAERFHRVEELFHRLVDLPRGEREKELAALAIGEPEAHRELVRLLGDSTALTQREGVLEGLAGDASDLVGRVRSSAGRERDEPPPDEEDPERVGRYRIVRRLGEGGMGRVYEAEQEEPVRRRVALKLIRAGFDSRAVISRFHSERQALAVMDHPNIARVLDAGTAEDGRPYFVMELVEGVPITDYCERHRLAVEERLELLVAVCEAVQHAHRKGVIHRDLKPSNLLVVEEEGPQGRLRPVPKVIDFGIAKAVGEDLVVRTLATRLGDLVGTPEYMSPEQATLGAVDVDTRSDVYALGLVLYELVVGDLPLHAEGAPKLAFDELCRRIREDDTPRPSTRLRARMASDRKGAGRPASLLSTDAGSLVRRVQGDLDRIALKALAKDRDQRYRSADELGEDLRRFLRHEPVGAASPGLGYRARKFVRRHRAGVTAAAAVVVALIAGLVVAGVGLVRARDAEREARRSLAATEATVDFLVGLFRGSDPRENPGLGLSARELLERGAERIGDLDGQPAVQARLLETLGDVYWTLGANEEGEPLLEQAIRLRESGEAADPVRLAMTLDRLAGLYRSRAELDRAEAAQRRALALLESELPLDAPELGRLLNDLGVTLRHAGRLDEALALYERSLAIVEKHEEPLSPNLASALNNVSRVYEKLDHRERARETSERALGIFQQILPPGHPSLATLHMNLAFTCRNQGELGVALAHAEKAVEIDRVALPSDHPGLADDLFTLGTVLDRLGRFAEAEEVFRESRAIYAGKFGDGAVRTLTPRNELGALAVERGDPAAAMEELRGVLAALETIDHPDRGRRRRLALRHLATAARAAGDLDTAWSAAERSGELADRADDAEGRAFADLQLALVALARGETDRADELFAGAESLPGCDRPCALDDASLRLLRAEYAAARGDADRAFALLADALEHPGRSAWLLVSPTLAALHDDPRWPGFAERVRRRLAES